MEFKKLLIVIPTRNRVELAIKAINSVLSQKNCNFELIVSDNSTEESEVETLLNYCRNIQDKRLRYIRPPKPLPMTDHWNWAMEQAMQSSTFTHITYLTDRMLFAQNSLAELQKIITKYQDKIVAYNIDSIDDTNFPAHLRQHLWTGKLFEISSLEFLRVYADMNFVHSIPRMLNCVVPRNILWQLYERDSSYFYSVSPDYNFAFKCLELEDSILYFDKSLLISYGENRSNGNSSSSGNLQKDSIDFIKNMKSMDVCFDTPVNYICILPNSVVHEYCLIRQAHNLNKLPEINYKKYFASLTTYVFSYQEPKMKQEMLKKLRSKFGSKLHIFRLQVILQRKLAGMKVRINNLFNISNPYLLTSKFETLDEAIDSAINHPRECSKNQSMLRTRLGVKSVKEVAI